MENSNSREYLEKITAAVIDNLRQTGPAPSVQMQDVPRKPFGAMTDEEEAELDDLDEDENKDVRMTENQWDKHVEHAGEFEPSDDDELARQNGATRQNGNKRPFTDYGNKDDVADADGKRARTAEPAEEAAEEPVADEPHDPNDDTIDDVGNGDKPEKEPEPEAAPAEEPAKEAVDEEGDVGMAEAEPASAEDTTIIKKEDAEPDVAEPADVPDDKKADEAKSDEPAAPADEEAPVSAKSPEKATPTAEAAEEPVKEQESIEKPEAEKPSEKEEEKREVEMTDDKP